MTFNLNIPVSNYETLSALWIHLSYPFHAEELERLWNGSEAL